MQSEEWKTLNDDEDEISMLDDTLSDSGPGLVAGFRLTSSPTVHAVIMLTILISVIGTPTPPSYAASVSVCVISVPAWHYTP